MEKDNNTEIKKAILEIVESSPDINSTIDGLNNLLSTLLPTKNADEIILVCNTGIICANKIERYEMSTQFSFLIAKVELTKPPFMIHELRSRTLAIGWFAHALKVEKEKCSGLDQKINLYWKNVQLHLNAGFDYLKKKPIVGAAGFCYQTAGEVYGSFYLQLKLYLMGSGRPWKSRFGNYKLVRFLNLDDLFLLDKASRKRLILIKSDCIKCLNLAIKYFKQEDSWRFLADCYLTLALEYHSFYSPIRSKLAIKKAATLIKKYNLVDLESRLISISSASLFGSDSD